MEPYRHLTWDSDFFGFKVAQIAPEAVGCARDLTAITEALRTAGYRLGYLRLPAGDVEPGALDTSQARHVDTRLTFTKALAAGASQEQVAGNAQIDTYRGESASAALVALAIESGTYSRFKLDPEFPDEIFRRIYTTWIERSVRGEMATRVFVARSKPDSATRGFVTVRHTDGASEIGLIAVHPEARGKGMARALIHCAERYMIECGKHVAVVATQERNEAAVRLYLSCGYRLERAERVFHLWVR